MLRLGGDAHLWLAFPDALADPSACLSLLSPDERRRADRLLRDGDRASFAAAHSLLRATLSRYAPVEPRAWRFRSGPDGKPAIEDGPPLRFNLSHTPGLAACVVTAGLECGVDVQEMTSLADPEELVPSVLAPPEAAELRALPPAARRDRFFALWTLKEAYLKGCGRGLSLPLDQVELRDLEAAAPRLRLGPAIGDRASDWQLYAGRAGPSHRAAVALRCAAGPRPALACFAVIGDLHTYRSFQLTPPPLP